MALSPVSREIAQRRNCFPAPIMTLRSRSARKFAKQDAVIVQGSVGFNSADMREEN